MFYFFISGPFFTIKITHVTGKNMNYVHKCVYNRSLEFEEEEEEEKN